MRTYYLFQAVNSPELRGFDEDPGGTHLPADLGPWALLQQIRPDEEWTLPVSRAVVAAGLLENGFYLWGPAERPGASHLVIESDRVEGTAVFDRPRHLRRCDVRRLPRHRQPPRDDPMGKTHL